MSKELPVTMRAWQYSSVRGGLDKNLKLNTIPLPKVKSNQHLVQVFACALNPALGHFVNSAVNLGVRYLEGGLLNYRTVDYKPAELINKLYPHLATPGLDFAGRIVKPASGSPFKVGDLVFGVAGTSPVAGGALAEYAMVAEKHAVALPEGVSTIDASTCGVAALTAYQSIVPRVKKGDRIFINGGSGGTGIFGIQFAKAVGCHVTTSCSTSNIELCKSLGADVVIDYKTQNLLSTLIATELKFDHAVDNVGKDFNLLWHAHEFLKPGMSLVCVGGEASIAGITDILKRKFIPTFLGGIKGKIEGFWPAPKPEDLAQVVEWIREGKVKPVIDTTFSFEQAPEAFTKLKTLHARGKIVVEVVTE